MLIDFERIKHYIKKPITGVIHIGSHKLEEVGEYDKIGVKDIVWIEGNKAIADHAQYQLQEDQILINSMMSDRNTYCFFYETKDSEKSSILKLTDDYKSLNPVRQIHRCPTVTLDKYKKKYIYPHHNFLAISVNGAELKVLNGANNVLKHIDYVYSRFYIKDLYKNNTKLADLDKFLVSRGFKKISVSMSQNTYGTALYYRFFKPKKGGY